MSSKRSTRAGKGSVSSPIPEKGQANVPLPEGFSQVCVWPGTVVGKGKEEEFEAYVAANFNGVRVKYLEEVLTLPDLKNGSPVKGTGGRNDLLFAVHHDDVGKFAVPRLAFGIRWIEDVWFNDQGHLYPERVGDYRSWDAGGEHEEVEV